MKKTTGTKLLGIDLETGGAFAKPGAAQTDNFITEIGMLWDNAFGRTAYKINLTRKELL